MKGAMCSSFCKAPNTAYYQQRASKKTQCLDRLCQVLIRFVKKTFPKHFLKQFMKVDKNQQKTVFKQIGSSTDKIISKPFPNYLY